MSHKQRTILFVVMIALGNLAYGASISSTFDSDLEGWTVRNNEPGGGASHIAAGGNPGGYMEIIDIEGFAGFEAVAPSKFLGDLSGFNGGSLSFDTNYLDSSGSADRPAYGTVTISSPGGVASLDFIPSNNPPMDQWESHSEALVASTWGKSQTEWISILTNVTDLSINLELFGGDDTVGLDNVNMVPLPASVWLLAPAITCLVALRRRGGRTQDA